MLAGAQEKTTDQSLQKPSQVVKETTHILEGGSTGGYMPTDVKILGDLDYGQTSGPVTYSTSPRYRAFVFSGYGGETVEVTVRGDDGKALVAVTDSSLNQIASGTTNLRLSLPNRGPDIEVWYIVFRETDNKPARFTVQVKKLGSISQKVSSKTVSQ